MANAENVSDQAVLQVAKWAAAYVENETGIPECPLGELRPVEVAALALIGAILRGVR